MQTRTKILLIDGDTTPLARGDALQNSNGAYEIVTLRGAFQAEDEIRSGAYDLIISNHSLPDRNGMDLLRQSRRVVPDTPFVVLGATGNVEAATMAIREGAADFVEKPLTTAKIKRLIGKATRINVASNSHNGRNGHARGLSRAGRDDNIIGRSAPMQQVFEMIARVAEGETSVTITGESGTGKELVARSIHAKSNRHSKPFVPVNCGAFPEQLFESELFGYEKGAFTGAYRRKLGLLEYADGGTFFLDEICELGMPLQVKLLRLLQEKRIRRVGGTEEIPIDVRIISASNRNLEQAVERNLLREDLYYRLNVISICLPLLRERKEDLKLLCQHFIDKYSKTSPKRIVGISDAALRCLEDYDWPGNIRELENVVERAITLATNEWIEIRDLPKNLICSRVDEPAVRSELPFKEAKDQVVELFEKEYVTKLLTRHNGNITKAAQTSGIARRTLHRLLKRHHISPRAWK